MSMLTKTAAQHILASLGEPKETRPRPMSYADHKAMLEALATGTATPDQQRACHAHIVAIKAAHARELRDAERDSRDAYFEGRANAEQDARGEPYGTY